ncbi:hypothetical protein HYFRA_00010324 [Hymenoscyphus fraxineus]|uniref:YjgF-like protein n=1 Tax=Hymenoscyphus fraxineus TaxID=746836 RepID=A0A9N9KZ83_9HELO|nr:hypothetical protein HYFRA_00010324 [Hymenoscyphus fraxineus]
MHLPGFLEKAKAIAGPPPDYVSRNPNSSHSRAPSDPASIGKDGKPIKKRRIKVSNIKMHSLSFSNGNDAGQKFSELCHYSQSVIVGNTCRVAAQGGWDNNGKIDEKNIMLQVDLAFDNIDAILRSQGLKGWEDVFAVRSFHTDLSVSFDLIVRKLKERIPGHKPIWTATGVKELAFPGMKVSIEVEALVGEDGSM